MLVAQQCYLQLSAMKCDPVVGGISMSFQMSNAPVNPALWLRKSARMGHETGGYNDCETAVGSSAALMRGGEPGTGDRWSGSGRVHCMGRIEVGRRRDAARFDSFGIRHKAEHDGYGIHIGFGRSGSAAFRTGSGPADGASRPAYWNVGFRRDEQLGSIQWWRCALNSEKRANANRLEI